MNARDDDVTSDPPDPPTTLPAISRRTALRRMRLLVGGAAAFVAAEACGSALWGAYAVHADHFGGQIIVGHKADFPAAMPQDCVLDRAGVFYRPEARAYIVHLSAATQWLVSGGALADALQAGSFLRDGDGSYWLVPYQACVHLGTTVSFLLSCRSFKCPSHGAHFHCDGEYLDGPAPRNLDRFPIAFDSAYVVVDTSRPNQSVERSSPEARLLAPPTGFCVYN